MASKKVSKNTKQILTGKEFATSKDTPHIGLLLQGALKISGDDDIGVICPINSDNNMKFAKIRMDAMLLALWMREQSISPGDIIAICTKNILEIYAPFIASMYIGAIVNLWQENCDKTHIQEFFQQIVPKIIFTSGTTAIRIIKVISEQKLPTKVVQMDATSKHELDFVFTSSLILSNMKDNREVQNKLSNFKCTKLKHTTQDTAMIVFSTNKTRSPKCVNIPYAIFTSPANQQLPSMYLGQTGMFLESNNLSFSLILIVRAILSRVTLVWAPQYATDYKERICQIIEKHQVSWLVMDDVKGQEFFRSGVFARYNTKSLKTLVINSAPIRQSVHSGLIKTLPHTVIYLLYSLPETGVITYQRVPGKLSYFGAVGENNCMMIVDMDNKKPLDSYEIGEIYCKCDSMMTGYYKDPKTDNKAIDDDGWFRTSYMGFCNNEGDLCIIGRINEIIRDKNHNTSATELKNVVKDHTAVQEVSEIPLPQATDKQHPTELVTKIPGSPVKTLKNKG